MIVDIINKKRLGKELSYYQCYLIADDFKTFEYKFDLNYKQQREGAPDDWSELVNEQYKNLGLDEDYNDWSTDIDIKNYFELIPNNEKQILITEDEKHTIQVMEDDENYYNKELDPEYISEK